MSDPQVYTPENDVTKKLEDGREVLVAAKGVAMPRAQAVSLGLIKEPQAQGPSEIKTETGDEEGQQGDSNQEASTDATTSGAGTVETGTSSPVAGEQEVAPLTPLTPEVTEPAPEPTGGRRKKDS